MRQKTKIPPVTIDRKVYEKFLLLNKRSGLKGAELIRNFVNWYTHQQFKTATVAEIVKKYSFSNKNLQSKNIDTTLYK